MRTTAVARAGALLIGLVAGLDLGSASAAGLDLERRLAELEETAAHPGNRKVSLRIYGQVNYALLSWDDGVTSDTYVVNNDTSSTRLGMIGRGEIGNGTVAGYRIEMEFEGASSMEVDARHDNFGTDQTIGLRHANWFIENAKLGRLTMGLGSPATDDITIISLGARMSDAALHYNNAFRLQFLPSAKAPNPFFNLRWGDLAHTVDSLRGNFVRYDTPSMMGFLLSAAAGEDDVWDVALRYADGPDWLQIAGGIGYMDNRELGIRDVRGSFSALHKSTGLFATVAGGLRDDYGATLDVARNSYFYFVQIGLSKRYLPFGDTTFYAEYGRYNDFGVGRVYDGMPDYRRRHLWSWGLIDSRVERWGIGIEQAVEPAGLLLYAQFQHFDGSFAGVKCGGPGCEPEGPSGAYDAQPWQAVVLGARIQF